MIRRGSVVRLKGRKKTAKVVELLADVKGGVVLDRPLGGFRCWNKNDLVKIDRREAEAIAERCVLAAMRAAE